MRVRILVATVAAALAVVAPATAGVRVSGIDTSGYPQLRVTVVAPLHSAAPRLTENGAPVVGARAVNLGRSKTVVLAIDRSQSMSGTPLANATAALRAFVAAKSPADRIAVIAFGHTALPLTRTSSSPTDALGVLGGLHTDPQSGTALWDAIVLASRRLAAEAAAGRVILVVSDGADVSSNATMDEAIAAAHRAHASVYAVGIAGPDFSPVPLRRIAGETGGLYVEATSSSQLGAIYGSIARTLAHTWQLTYPTAARPGDRLTVAAAVPGEGSGRRTATIAGLVPEVVPEQPSGLLPRSAWASAAAPLVVSACVALLALLAFCFLSAARGGRWLTARLAPHIGPASAHDARPRRRRSGGRPLSGVFTATDRAFANVAQFKSLQAMLVRADLPVRASELLFICVGCGFALALLAAVGGGPSLLILVLFALGGSGPVLFASFKARGRIRAFDNQLPDLLITIAASLKAGHSFRHAIQAVVDEGAAPAADEFRRIINETRLGRPMDDALADMAERVGSKNLTFVLTAVTIQRQIGGSLAGLFDTVAETVRQRQQFARKIKSLTAMGRISSWVLIGLPFGVAFALTAMNPTYMSALWTTPTGHKLVLVALGMMAVGTVLLKKIVSFKG